MPCVGYYSLGFRVSFLVLGSWARATSKSMIEQGSSRTCAVCLGVVHNVLEMAPRTVRSTQKWH